MMYTERWNSAAICRPVSPLATQGNKSSPWLWMQYVPTKRRSTSTSLHGATFQKTLNFKFAAVRTWNLIYSIFFIYKETTQQIIPVSLIAKISFYSAAARNCSVALLHHYPGPSSLIAWHNTWSCRINQ
jgi:hypothetical protein